MKMKEVEVWECDNCGHMEFHEGEVMCWQCGEGEMIFQGTTFVADYE